MILAWKQRRQNKRLGRIKNNNDTSQRNDLLHHSSTTLRIPSHFLCPISLDLMKDPVTLSTGITYDRDSIEKWILTGNQTCPVTNQTLQNSDQIPNHSIRRMIQDWCVENKSFGIERIPTPRIPVSSYEVTGIFSRIREASTRKDKKECQELVDRIKNLARDSERNKNRIIDNGVGYVFAACFASFAEEEESWDDCEDLLKTIMCELTWMFPPLGSEGQSKIGSQKSLRCIAWFLNGQDLSAKQHAVILSRELLLVCNSSDISYYANELLKIEGVLEALFQIVKVPICPAATTSALTVMYHMLLCLSSTIIDDDKLITRYLNMGLVQMILEMLVDEGEKNISEKGLGVLDCLCNFEEGRESVGKNGLTMAVLVKKILRVSNMATEFTVSIMWKLCKLGDEDEKRVVLLLDAMDVGAFQKLLVMLQVGCGGKTKEKTTELLKMMNLLYKDHRMDCLLHLDGTTAGFMYVKRSC